MKDPKFVESKLRVKASPQLQEEVEAELGLPEVWSRAELISTNYKENIKTNSPQIHLNSTSRVK